LAAMNRRLPSLSPAANRYLARSGNDLCLKDLLTDKELVKLSPNPQPMAPGIVDPNFIEGPARFSADGKTAALLASRSRQSKDRVINVDHQAIFFDLVTGQELSRIPIKGRDLRKFALAPDGKRAASIVNGVVHICDVATGASLWQAPDEGAEAVALAFSSDGNRLITALDDTTFLVWDVSSTYRPRKNQP